MGEEVQYPPFSNPWLSPPPALIIKDRLTGVKQRSNMYASCILGRYPGKLSNPPMWPKTSLGVPSSAKDIGAGE